MGNPLCMTAVALAAMLMSPTVTHGQFNTVNSGNDLLSVSLDPYSYHKGEGKPSKDVAKLREKTSGQTQNEKKLSLSDRKISVPSSSKTVKEDKNSDPDSSDSIIFDLIKKRLNVCMPLDYMRITSMYGYRTHPIKRCQRFHDGIDLAAGKDLVFSMLPGTVEAVRHGNTGYGNYVVLCHGNLRCLYGHLSSTMVSEGDIVDAGTAVGVTGRSGTATGPHLHLRLQKWNGKAWTSVNPKAFTDFLDGYIAELNEDLRKYNCQEPPRDEALTVASLYAAIRRHNIKYPKIVLAQAILETGWFRSSVARNKNNLFGLRNPRTGEYFSFARWEDSVIAYRDKVQYKYRQGENYYSFLDRIHYAGDRSYISKVRQIADKL